jgi:hypothetical protein
MSYQVGFERVVQQTLPDVPGVTRSPRGPSHALSWDFKVREHGKALCGAEVEASLERFPGERAQCAECEQLASEG